MDTDNRFGGYGRRLLGELRLPPGREIDVNERFDPETEEAISKARIAAVDIARVGGKPIAVSYQTPKQRALSTAQRTGLSAFLALVITAVGDIIIQFLVTGDFSPNALRTFGISVAVALLTVAMNWAQKLNEAKQDDQPPVP